MEKAIIRKAELGDISELFVLCAELGYSATSEEIISRLKRIITSGSDDVFVAVEKTVILGWIHVFGSLRLESDPFAEIGGLVVSSKHRNKGIGKILVRAAEKWAKENDYLKIRVRSRIERTEAKKIL